MGLFTVEELAWLESFLRFDGDRLAKVVLAGADATLEVDAAAERARLGSGGTLSQGQCEFFADESTEAYNLRSTLADLTLLATYHWIERQTKSFAKRLGKKTNDPTDVMSLNAPKLAAFLGAKGVVVANVQHWANVELLRHFANSWKHNADEASAELLAALALAHPPGHHLKGSLSDACLREAFARALGLTQGAADDAVAQKAVEVAHDYLVELAKALP